MTQLNSSYLTADSASRLSLQLECRCKDAAVSEDWIELAAMCASSQDAKE